MANRRKVILGAALATLVALGVLAIAFHAHSENTFYVYFNDVQGLRAGATVVAYEAAVGKVSRVKAVKGDHKYKVTLLINKDVKFYGDADIRIAPVAKGETFVNIESLGTAGAGHNPLGTKSNIVGKESAGSKTSSANIHVRAARSV